MLQEGPGASRRHLGRRYQKRPQKGSGRARAGTTRSPIWRSGGVTFAAQPKHYNKKINKKMYKGALNCIFNELLKRKKLHLTDKLTFNDKKTKLGKEFLSKMKVTNVLFITSLENVNAFFSSKPEWVCEFQFFT